jgi:hypothetical protein
MTDSAWPLMGVGIFAIIVLVGVFVIWRILKERSSGFPAKDERTQKITGMAATYAFYIGSYFMLALMLTNILSQELLGVPFPGERYQGYPLIISVIVQSLTFLGFRSYFDRKGDL